MFIKAAFSLTKLGQVLQNRFLFSNAYSLFQRGYLQLHTRMFSYLVVELQVSLFLARNNV